jgi:5-hydroxyisourate hydrolase-like protein (transthyretin family)
MKVNESKSSLIKFTHQKGHCPAVNINQTVIPKTEAVKYRRATLRLQVKLERTRRQKRKTNRLKSKRDQLVNRKKIPSIYRKQITHLQSGIQTDMELQNRTVGLHQQVQHSHHVEIPIQNSQSHGHCPLICNKSYSTYRLQHPLRMKESINITTKWKTIPVHYYSHYYKL